MNKSVDKTDQQPLHLEISFFDPLNLQAPLRNVQSDFNAGEQR